MQKFLVKDVLQKKTRLLIVTKNIHGFSVFQNFSYEIGRFKEEDWGFTHLQDPRTTEFSQHNNY